MGCPRNGEVCNEFYCGGNSYGVCVAGDDTRIEDFLAAHDKEIRRQITKEVANKLNKITAILSEYEQCQESAPAYYLKKIMAVVLDDEEDDGK